MKEQFSQDIFIVGSKEQVEVVKKALSPTMQKTIALVYQEEKSSLRIVIQDTIDLYGLTAVIIHKGERVWSRTKIMANMQKIRTQGPEHLNNYFYDFIKTSCGSAVYFNKAAWIRAHSTLEDFGKFFLKNDYNKNVIDYIPIWKADAKRIAMDIERILFPFQTLMRNRKHKN